MSDPNMVAAVLFARGLVAQIELPASMIDVDRRAALVERVDGLFMIVDGMGRQIGLEDFGRRLSTIEKESRGFLPDVSDAMDRLSVALRLWSGCLSAAKTIALETRSGPNTAEGRQQTMRELDAVAATDAVFGAGVESAPVFKRNRGQSISLDGVAENSVVRRYA